MTLPNRFQLIVLLIAIAFNLKAQNNSQYNSSVNLPLLVDEGIICARQYFNPYPTNQLQYFDNWTNGTIIFEDGKQISGQKLRYNSWLDELAWLREEDYCVGLVLKEKVSEFYLDAQNNLLARHFIKIRISEMGGLQDKEVYLQLLANGSTRLFCHYKTLLTTHTGTMKKKEFYYLEYENQLVKIAANRRSVLSVFNPVDKSAMKEIIRQNKLKIRKTDHLIQAIDILNQQRVNATREK